MRPIKDWGVASLSPVAGPVTKQMVPEACDILIREKHPASPPEWPKDTRTPAQGGQSWPGETEILQEPPPPRRKTASIPRPEKGGPRRERSRGRFRPCGVRALLSGKKNHQPCTRASRRPRSLGAMEATGQRTSKAGGRSDTTQRHGPLPTRMGTAGTRKD